MKKFQIEKHFSKTIRTSMRQSSPLFVSDAGLNFELQFDSNSSGHILAPGPKEPLEQLTVCLWLKISVASTFVSYHVEHDDGPAFSFGIGSANYLFVHINGNRVNRYVLNTCTPCKKIGEYP